MEEFEMFSISDVRQKGMSAVIRSAVENGCSIISNRGENVGMVLPFDAEGMKRFFKTIIKKSKEEDAPADLIDVSEFLKSYFEKKGVELN